MSENKPTDDEINCYLDWLHGIRTSFISARASATPPKPELTYSQQLVLHTLGRAKSVIIRDLAEQLDLSPSNTSLLVDSLVKMKYVIRKQSIQDRRRWFISLTKKGQQYYEVYWQHIKCYTAEFLSALTVSERQIFFQLYEKLFQQAQFLKLKR